FRAIGRGVFFGLHIGLHNQPANVARPNEIGNLVRRVGIDGGIEERYGEARTAAGGEIKGFFSWNQNDSVVEGNVGPDVAQQLVDFWQIRARRGKTRERGKRGVRRRAIGKVGVVEPLLAGRVEASTN